MDTYIYPYISAGNSTDASRSVAERLLSDRFMSKPDFIFWYSEGHKGIEKAQFWTTEFLSKVEFGVEETVIRTAGAEHDYDLLPQIKV